MLRLNELKLLIFILLSLLSLIAISLSVGASGLNFFELIKSNSSHDRAILIDLRFNRTMLSIFIGAILATSGLLLQSFLQNPLSEPYTLGLSGGASLGAVLFITLGFDSKFIAVGSFLGCWIITLIIIKAKKFFGFKSSKSLILFGVMVSFLCGAVVTLLIALLDPNNIQLALFWLMGQVSENGKYWPIAAISFFIAFFWILRNHRSLDMFLIDSRTSFSICSKSNMETKVILLVSLMTSVAVCLSGLIGFVGLLAPHIVKMYLKTSRHLMCLVFTPILGGLFLLSSDVLARLIGGSMEIPSGSITAIVGAPFFIYILFSGLKNA